MQKRDVSRLGEIKLLITKEKSSKEDEESSMKCIVSNKNKRLCDVQIYSPTSEYHSARHPVNNTILNSSTSQEYKQ